ncbi:MAG: sulfate permease [Tessaracoccus sp.]
MRRLFPTNRIRDAVLYTRRGLPWGVPTMPLAAPYLYTAELLTEHIAQGGPGWLHLVVLLCVVNTIKMLLIGPISLVAVRYLERKTRKQAATAAMESETEPAAEDGMPVGGAS